MHDGYLLVFTLKLFYMQYYIIIFSTNPFHILWNIPVLKYRFTINTGISRNASFTNVVKGNISKQSLTYFEIPNKMKVTRLCTEEYLLYGFVKLMDSNTKEQSLYLMLKNVLDNESLQYSKLKQHLEKRQNKVSCKSLKYFQSTKRELQSSLKVLCLFTFVTLIVTYYNI